MYFLLISLVNEEGESSEITGALTETVSMYQLHRFFLNGRR